MPKTPEKRQRSAKDAKEVPEPLELSAHDPVSRDLEVPPTLAGMRADRAAADLLPEFSRAQLTRWLREGALTFDGKSPAPKTRLVGGERLRLEVDGVRDRGLEGQDVPFEVRFEDEHLLVVEKPAGVVVHPGAGNPDLTLVNGLVRYRPGLDALPRAGLIHRLDKGTSGLLIAAATEAAFQTLTRMLAERDIARRYQAVVEGPLTGGRDIEGAIGRDPRNRLKQRLRDDGRYALTTVRLMERFRRHTLIEARLATGRTHQIRVHLSSIGHPLVGDRTYGSRGLLPRSPTPELVSRIRGFDRPALHAWRLEFAHPADPERQLTIESEPPDDFAALVVDLRQDTRDERAQSR